MECRKGNNAVTGDTSCGECFWSRKQEYKDGAIEGSLKRLVDY